MATAAQQIALNDTFVSPYLTYGYHLPPSINAFKGKGFEQYVIVFL